MTEAEKLEKECEVYDKARLYQDDAYFRNHPTYKLDEHPEGFEQECFCYECTTCD